MKSFSFRFDIDSLADIEVGLPKILEIGKRLDIRFTFFINMGKSFNWKTVFSRRIVEARSSSHANALNKLGFSRTLRTAFLNPDIGLANKKILFELIDDGHELGLHGGMDHPLWQWELERLSRAQLNDLLKPAYDHFSRLFGKPKGFASPGFRCNDHVLALMDDFGFEYASDREGEKPFMPDGFRHMQVPVNVYGPSRFPLIEHLYKSRADEGAILKRCQEEIEERDIAVMYGHPAFEGDFRGLGDLFSWVRQKDYRIVPIEEIL